MKTRCPVLVAIPQSSGLSTTPGVSSTPQRMRLSRSEWSSRPRNPGRGRSTSISSSEGHRLEIDLLSAGQLELFLFLGVLALNEDREGIIFIDEPELHLDPQWHRPILRSLMRLQPHAQLVVATHSPEIYDAAASYERHYLVPEDDPRSWLWARHGGVESGV